MMYNSSSKRAYYSRTSIVDLKPIYFDSLREIGIWRDTMIKSYDNLDIARFDKFCNEIVDSYLTGHTSKACIYFNIKDYLLKYESSSTIEHKSEETNEKLLLLL